MRTIKAFEIIDHGVDHAQYFQGCGVSFSEYDMAFTGAGCDAKEAYEDAVEQVASSDWDVAKLPKRPRGIRKTDQVPAESLEDEMSEIYYYVSIRLR